MKRTARRLPAFGILLAGLALGSWSRAANILVVETQLDTVSQYTSGGGLISSNFISGLSSAGGIAVNNSSGIIYVGLPQQSAIAEYNSGGTQFATITSGINGPSGLATDAGGNLWVVNTTGNTVTEYNSSGALIHTTTGFTDPTAIAFDTAGNAYVTEFIGTVMKLNSAGTVTNSSYISSGSLVQSQGIATDSSNDLFISSVGSNSVLEYNSSGTLLRTLTNSLSGPAGMLVDSAGDLLVANSGSGATGTVSEFNSIGTLLSGSFISATGSPEFTYMAFQSAPEPERAALLLVGLGGMVMRRRR